MRYLVGTTTQEVYYFLKEIETKSGARKRLISATECEQIIDHAKKARSLAESLGKKVRVWSRRAMPTKYAWSKAGYTQWIVEADPMTGVTISGRRLKMPANSKSFNGVECEIEGMDKREILWRAGLQRQRVLSWEPKVIQAVQALSILTLALIFSIH